MRDVVLYASCIILVTVLIGMFGGIVIVNPAHPWVILFGIWHIALFAAVLPGIVLGNVVRHFIVRNT